MKKTTETRKLRVWSNLAGLNRVRCDALQVCVQAYPTGKKGFLDVIRIYLQSYKFNYLLLNTPPSDLYILALLKYFIPFNRCRFVTMDCVLPMPEGLAQRIKARIKGVIFRKVDLYIEYFRNTKGYETFYNMKGERFRYVPFKVNRFETVVKCRTSDQGYVFSGGNTRRDFETLLDTARHLSVPFKIVTMRNNIIMKHGSHLDDTKVPENVQVIRHDGSDSFIDYIAGSKMVVLPIKKKNISSSGIGVYLTSMALGKCVIISSGVGVDDVLTDGQAYIVPPEDPVALRDAINKLYNDDDLREEYARKGREYALSLEGEDRLAESAIDVLIEDARRMSQSDLYGRSIA